MPWFGQSSDGNDLRAEIWYRSERPFSNHLQATLTQVDGAHVVEYSKSVAFDAVVLNVEDEVISGDHPYVTSIGVIPKKQRGCVDSVLYIIAKLAKEKGVRPAKFMLTSFMDALLPGGLDNPVVLPVAAPVVHVARDLDGGVRRVADVVVPHRDVVVPGNLRGAIHL